MGKEAPIELPPPFPSPSERAPLEQAFGAISDGLMPPEEYELASLTKAQGRFLDILLHLDRPILYTSHPLHSHELMPPANGRAFVRTVLGKPHLFERLDVIIERPNGVIRLTLPGKTSESTFFFAWKQLRKQKKYLVLMESLPREIAMKKPTLAPAAELFRETRKPRPSISPTITSFFQLPLNERKKLRNKMPETWTRSLDAKFIRTRKGKKIMLTANPNEAAAKQTPYDERRLHQYIAGAERLMQKYLQTPKAERKNLFIPEIIKTFLKLPKDDQIVLLYALMPIERAIIAKKYTVYKNLKRQLVRIDPDIRTRANHLNRERSIHDHSYALRSIAKNLSTRKTGKDGKTKWYTALLPPEVIKFLSLSKAAQKQTYDQWGPIITRVAKALYNLDQYYGSIPMKVDYAEVKKRLTLGQYQLSNWLPKIKKGLPHCL